MLTGITLQAHPTARQKQIISQWMGCARFVWNAKCEEEKYLMHYARRYLPIGTYPSIDQTFSQYKDKELSPWLFDCPSQILRNSAANWYQVYRNFLKGQCGKPNRKKKSDTESVHLTRELFRFEKGDDGVMRLFVGSKTNNIGFLAIKNHTSYAEPKSIRIKKKNGRYCVSFCYEDDIEDSKDIYEHLGYLKNLSKEELEGMTIGVDRGVKRPVQAGDEAYDFSMEQKRKKRLKNDASKEVKRHLPENRKFQEEEKIKNANCQEPMKK